MSSENRVRELEDALPPEIRQRINRVVEEITEHMDRVVQHEEKIDELITHFIGLLEEIGLPSEMVSAYIKQKLRGIVSDRTIERHLEKKFKRKYESLPRDSKATVVNIHHKKTIEVSSTGEESLNPAAADNQIHHEVQHIPADNQRSGGFTETEVIIPQTEVHSPGTA